MEERLNVTSDNIYVLSQLRQMNETFSKQFVEMNAKLDMVQSTVQLLSHAMVTVQEKLEVMQNSLSSSSDYYEVAKDNTEAICNMMVQLSLCYYYYTLLLIIIVLCSYSSLS